MTGKMSFIFRYGNSEPYNLEQSKSARFILYKFEPSKSEYLYSGSGMPYNSRDSVYYQIFNTSPFSFPSGELLSIHDHTNKNNV